MEKREINPAAAMLVYEVHLGSWKKGLTYKELALELSAYCKQMGFTHVELLPVMEHPLDESWGYQVTGFFAVTSRWGTPRDFQFFVDHLHQEGIGVILDWVPAHFPLDEHALAHFDGSYLYEHADPRQGIHPHWNTCIFNYGRAEVSNFLIASALFWADKMHVDGLRVDAVASMLYLDYGRGEGEWIPNCYGGNHNLEAIEWIKHCNAALEKAHPTVHRIAEESTAFLGVTHPLSQGGLGFTLKWNMGWMNDTLHYFSRDPFFRSHHHNALTFGLTYAFSERFLLPLSHDEVVHGKGSLLSKMPGDGWQKRANLRLLYSYQICQLGKKLLFMGGELGVEKEWDCKGELAWHLLHTELHHFFRDMNHFYLQCPALFERDYSYEGFEWVDLSDRQGSVISYLRKSSYTTVLVVHNCTPITHFGYRLYLPFSLPLEEVFNTDRIEYGGSGQGNPHAEIHEGVLTLTLAPLSTQIFKVLCG
jgi:1,4-alpha-glucan branching enzyme